MQRQRAGPLHQGRLHSCAGLVLTSSASTYPQTGVRLRQCPAETASCSAQVPFADGGNHTDVAFRELAIPGDYNSNDSGRHLVLSTSSVVGSEI